jgi:hypothetical protein
MTDTHYCPHFSSDGYREYRANGRVKHYTFVPVESDGKDPYTAATQALNFFGGEIVGMTRHRSEKKRKQIRYRDSVRH